MISNLTISSSATTVLDIYLHLSNIGNTINNPTGSIPKTTGIKQITGLNVDGYIMVDLEQIKTYIGATTNYSYTNQWRIIRNGQTLTFTPNSVNYSSTTPYSVIDRQTGLTNNYSNTVNGYAAISSQIINSKKYVSFNVLMNQLGALVVGLDPLTGLYTAFDWRINVNSPYTDSNIYIVGGPWLSGWAAKGTSQIAPHFTYAELRDPSSVSENPTYFSQLKISQKQLQVIENVRGYYNNNASMPLSSGFRSYVNNNLQTGSWVKSFHTRGRATDIPSIPLYNSIYNEFKNGQSAPIAVYSGSVLIYYRTRNTNNLSQGYEIESMPQPNGTWLHIQSVPGYDTAALAP